MFFISYKFFTYISDYLFIYLFKKPKFLVLVYVLCYGSFLKETKQGAVHCGWVNPKFNIAIKQLINIVIYDVS